MINQALPIRMGAGSPYFIPAWATPLRGKSKSWHTSDSRGCFALPAASRSRHGLFLCVQRVYWWKQTVEACGTSSSGGLWEGAWDFPCSSSSSLLELTPSLLSRIYLGVTPSQKHWYCAYWNSEVACDTYYCLSRHGWFSNLNQMPPK